MKRAAVIIGVNKSGDLPVLKDAVKGAALVERWARDQQFDVVHLITDAKGPVDVSAVKRAIREIVDAANIGQLIVYFAGHGVNRERREYWLLSDAPDDANAAVNVAGSVALAVTCAIPHVVLISDACRTAADGIRAQSVTGSEVFPNRDGNEHPVDQFFACRLGYPSHEIRDPAVSSAEFNALYTNELVPALMGRRPQIIERASPGADVGWIRPRPLRDFLAGAVSERLSQLHLQTEVVQVPTAQISSDPGAWISQVPAGVAPRGKSVSLGLALPRPVRPLVRISNTETVSATLFQSALTGGSEQLTAELQKGLSSQVAGASELVKSIDFLAQPVGQMHHETQCGFKVRGARLVDMHARGIVLERAAAGCGGPEDIRVGGVPMPGVSVLLVFEGEKAVLVPAIPGFLATLTLEHDELIDVAYEPSANSGRWSFYESRAPEIRTLRAIAASAMARGVFRLEGDEALDVARRMQYAKGVDPALAVYAAYAYHELQRFDRLREMHEFMQIDLGAPLFDVALLAKTIRKREISAQTNVLGSIPLLAQGWALLGAYEVSLPKRLRRLRTCLQPSLWTMFDLQGAKLARAAIDSGEIR